MHRYFLEVAYKGTHFSGFQVQHNANTIQAEVEKALAVLFRQPFSLTGSSRTDAGVHALQNYFHFDTELQITGRNLYNLNALLPAAITAKSVHAVNNTNHCRFDAVSREYKYVICLQKDPFLYETAYYYPFKLQFDALNTCANLLTAYHDFTSFSKRNTQVKTFTCSLQYSQWAIENNCLVYSVIANRFLRGMVRGLVASMLKTARGVITVDQFRHIIESKDCTRADFSAQAQGLFLVNVNYPEGLLQPQL